MKNLKKYSILTLILASATFQIGCSDEFLKEKQNFANTTDIIYTTYQGARGRIDDIYSLLLPRSVSGVTYDFPSAGISDVYSASTEEYGGLSEYVSDNVINNTTVDDYFYGEAKTSRSPYGRIRNCNDAIEGIENGTLPENQKRELLGQAYFFRAWVYYRLVNVYGGVPIVDKFQNPVVGNTGGLDLVTPRSTTKQCIEFICADLQKSADYLPVLWDDANWGRVTSGTALAVMGRVRLLYASPLFNRTDITERWDSAYAVNKRAIDKLNSSGFFGLANLDKPGVNASGWAKMFSDTKSPEAVFVTLYNTVKQSGSTNTNLNNAWENSIRPYNTGSGSSGKGTTAQMVDLFPMADGTPAVDKSWNPINGYDPQLFLLNRDPRFYRTFAFPGVEWRFSGDPTSLGITSYPCKGDSYALWNYTWYSNATDQTDAGKSGYAADGLGTSYRGVYIRKRTDDLAVNPNPLYIFDLINSFTLSAAPYMEIRYAEVLLNFAESANGAGHGDEALAALRLIRNRVGYTGTCGLADALASDRAGLFAAILYERQIELAYEGKRFYDMRRWMLWDGGVGQSALNPSWELKGFNQNTCTYLGVEPLNGKQRTGIDIVVSSAVPGGGIAPVTQFDVTGKIYNDPIISHSIRRPHAWNLCEANAATSKLQKDSIENFYRYNLTRKKRSVDASGKVISFRPEYYFIGLKSGAQVNNVTLLQTIGWTDAQRGGMGTYDPLAE